MTRLSQAWRALEPEQRLAALAALGLFVSMFLPWYSKTYTVVVHGAAKSTATSLSATETSLSAFQAFSFVEAAVLLVSAGVLTMLFARAEGRDVPAPRRRRADRDGRRRLDGAADLLSPARQAGAAGQRRITATVGVEWGIFIALLLALGARLRRLADARPRTTRTAVASPPRAPEAAERPRQPGCTHPRRPPSGDRPRTPTSR